MPLLALDLGTSSVKVVVCDDRGAILSSASAEYPLHQPRPGWSEQDPEDWWRGSVQAIRQAIAAVPDGTSVRAVGLSGQMHGSVLLDAAAAGSEGRAAALRPAILWNDQRTRAQCAAIERAIGSRRACVEQLGNAPLAGFTLPKLLWVREHEPEVWCEVRHVLLPKDFIRFRLTGEMATDVGDAGGMLLLDVDGRKWNEAAAARVGIDPAILPPIFESCAVAGHVSAWAAEATGLPAGIPVVAGSGDNQCAAAGAGVVSPGQVLAVLGTSGVVYAHASRPTRDLPRGLSAEDAPVGRLQAFCAPDGGAAAPGQWCVTGCMLSAAGALSWCRRTIAPGVAFEELMHEAGSVPPGSEGLVFLPYLTGERCPHADPEARGGWIGLTSRHMRGHLVRAVLEGVTFGMGQMLDLMRASGVKVERVRLSGGGNRASLWRQMQADGYGVPVETTAGEEGGSALGAALMAGVGCGAWPSLRAATEAAIGVVERREPAGDGAYDRVREVYERLYPRLREDMAALGAC